MTLLHDEAPRRLLLLGFLWMSAVLFCGCARDEPLEYAANDQVQELSAAHQRVIGDVLDAYYGTPNTPKWMMPTGEFDDDEQPILKPHMDSDWLEAGAASYQRRCAGCHGVTGDGKGEAAEYLNPKPRDYRRGIYKFTSTPYGYRPRREDIVRTIRRGAKGTSMPSFRWLSKEEMQPLVDYVILLSYRGELEGAMTQELEFFEEDELDEAEEVLDVLDELAVDALAQEIHERWLRADGSIVYPEVPPPPYSEETIAKGRELFVGQECAKCHGKDGRGQTEWLSPKFIAELEAQPPGQGIQINRDAWGNVAPAADLTAGMLHGGRRPIDIYRRIYSGINGTPMPGFANKFAADEDRIKIWYLTHFVISLTEGRDFSKEASAADEESSSDSNQP